MDNDKNRLKLSKEMCRNLYFMLCYASDETKGLMQSEVAFDDEHGIDELFGVLILNALKIMEKGHPIKEYKTVEVCSNKVHGRVDLIKSITSGKIFRGEVYSSVRKLDNDTIYNSIILLTLSKIISNRLKIETYTQLMRYNERFRGARILSIDEYKMLHIKIKSLPYHYRPIMTACKITLENMLVSDEDNIPKNAELFEEDEAKRYAKIFENFVKGFYKQEYKADVLEPKYRYINKQGKISRTLIPDMVLQYNNKALVIDTKWYTSFDTQKGTDTSNQDQIHRYITKVYDDKDIESSGGITGVILYADNGKIKCDEFISADLDSSEKGITYRRIINLSNQSFDEIKQSLIDLADEFLCDDLLDRL